MTNDGDTESINSDITNDITEQLNQSGLGTDVTFENLQGCKPH